MFKEIVIGTIKEKFRMENIIGASIASYDKKKVSLLVNGVGTKTYNFSTELDAKTFYDSIQ